MLCGEGQFVLASGSPRRQQLLSDLGFSFTVVPADVDEQRQPGEEPEQMARRLAANKARVVAAACPAAYVLAADTIVLLAGRVLGKPADPAQAVAMLKALRGRRHQVLTAVALAGSGLLRVEVERSTVLLREYSAAEMAAYVASGDPLDKAGAYAVQSRTFRPVADVEGCYANVMGLPLARVSALLGGVGVFPRNDVTTVCHEQFGRCCLDDGKAIGPS